MLNRTSSLSESEKAKSLTAISQSPLIAKVTARMRKLGPLFFIVVGAPVGVTAEPAGCGDRAAHSLKTWRGMVVTSIDCLALVGQPMPQ